MYIYSGGVILINVEGVTGDYVVDLLISRPDCGKEENILRLSRSLCFIYNRAAGKSDRLLLTAVFLLVSGFHKEFEKCLYCFVDAASAERDLFIFSVFCHTKMLQCISCCREARGTF